MSATTTQEKEHAETRDLEAETERLQREVEALKKLQRLKREEVELKKWLSGQSRQGQEEVKEEVKNGNLAPLPEKEESGHLAPPPPPPRKASLQEEVNGCLALPPPPRTRKASSPGAPPPKEEESSYLAPPPRKASSLEEECTYLSPPPPPPRKASAPGAPPPKEEESSFLAPPPPPPPRKASAPGAPPPNEKENSYLTPPPPPQGSSRGLRQIKKRSFRLRSSQPDNSYSDVTRDTENGFDRPWRDRWKSKARGRRPSDDSGSVSSASSSISRASSVISWASSVFCSSSSRAFSLLHSSSSWASSLLRRLEVSTRRFTGNAATDTNVRAVLPRELLGKIATAILTDLDDETLQREDTETILIIITLVKEAIFGILIAFALISFVLFLDHRFLLNFPTSSNVRRATASLMTNSETLADLEAISGWKFVEMDEYNSMVSEIGNVGNKTAPMASLYNKRSVDLARNKVDLRRAKQNLQRMKADLGLDLFCGDCAYSRKMTCGDRVKALGESYDVPTFKAMISAMQRESCRRYPEGEQGEKRKREVQNVLQSELDHDGNRAAREVARNWHIYEDNFCEGCAWEDGTTCGKRSKYLITRYGTPETEARAQVMVENKRCRNDYYEGKIERMGGFCPKCHWGYKSTRSCEDRVSYLMKTFGHPELVAQLTAMEKPSCVGKG